MRYNKKFITAFIIQGNYGQGWEDETEESTHKDARVQLKAYRENSQYPSRLVRRKVGNPDYLPNAMTKKQAETQFKSEFLPSLDKTDRPLIRFEWNCFVDMLQKSGQITAKQAANWCQPKFVSR